VRLDGEQQKGVPAILVVDGQISKETLEVLRNQPYLITKTLPYELIGHDFKIHMQGPNFYQAWKMVAITGQH
jgi:hypothetical protein